MRLSVVVCCRQQWPRVWRCPNDWSSSGHLCFHPFLPTLNLRKFDLTITASAARALHNTQEAFSCPPIELFLPADGARTTQHRKQCTTQHLCATQTQAQLTENTTHEVGQQWWWWTHRTQEEGSRWSLAGTMTVKTRQEQNLEHFRIWKQHEKCTHCALSPLVIVVQFLLSLIWQHLKQSWQDLVKMQKW